jgi:hypothetical protein
MISNTCIMSAPITIPNLNLLAASSTTTTATATATTTATATNLSNDFCEDDFFAMN